jgi:hypothetical protein
LRISIKFFIWLDSIFDADDMSSATDVCNYGRDLESEDGTTAYYDEVKSIRASKVVMAGPADCAVTAGRY